MYQRQNPHVWCARIVIKKWYYPVASRVVLFYCLSLSNSEISINITITKGAHITRRTNNSILICVPPFLESTHHTLQFCLKLII